LTLLFVEDWRLGLSMLAFNIVALLVLMGIRTLAIPQWKIVREQMVEFYGFVGEQFAGTEDIRVSFGYDENEPVLQEISFALEPGRVLGLLGRTGSGKTTLARLLLRLYDVDQGQITLNGILPQDATLHNVRQRVGMVTQNVELFRASVRQNLTLFNPNISDNQLLDVLSDLGLSEWLAGLPDGLDAELAAGDSNLSAGEAQLLAFASLFLADPGLVILDEASSRLDMGARPRGSHAGRRPV
jgi:ATP-binding cassette subfamily B protein